MLAGGPPWPTGCQPAREWSVTRDACKRALLNSLARLPASCQPAAKCQLPAQSSHQCPLDARLPILPARQPFFFFKVPFRFS